MPSDEELRGLPMTLISVACNLQLLHQSYGVGEGLSYLFGVGHISDNSHHGEDYDVTDERYYHEYKAGEGPEFHRRHTSNLIVLRFNFKTWGGKR